MPAPNRKSPPYSSATKTTTPRFVARTVPALLSVPTKLYEVARRSGEVVVRMSKVRPIITSAIEIEARAIPSKTVMGVGASAYAVMAQADARIPTMSVRLSPRILSLAPTALVTMPATLLIVLKRP